MSNVSYLDVKPEMAAKALVADNEAKREFFEKVVEFSKTFSVKETSRLLKISVGWLRTYSAEKGITFPDPLTRSKEEQRAVNRQFEKLRPLKELRKVEPVARALPGQLQLTPELEVLSRRALRRAKVAFHKRVTELAEVFSLHEAAELLNVGVRYLKNYGYEWDIQFCGEQRPYAVNVAEAVIETSIEAVADTAVDADVPATPPAVVAAEVAAVVPAEAAHLVADNVAAAAVAASGTAASSGAGTPAIADTPTKATRSAVSPVRTKNPFINAEIRGDDLALAARISRYPKKRVPIGSSYSLF
jgi:phage antirepressor YoqD-like protein